MGAQRPSVEQPGVPTGVAAQRPSVVVVVLPHVKTVILCCYRHLKPTGVWGDSIQDHPGVSATLLVAVGYSCALMTSPRACPARGAPWGLPAFVLDADDRPRDAQKPTLISQTAGTTIVVYRSKTAQIQAGGGLFSRSTYINTCTEGCTPRSMGETRGSPK